MARRGSSASFEIRAGSKKVGSVNASTPHEALTHFLRARGCRDDEISRRGRDSVSWRGALYRAVPAPEAP